MKIGKPSRYYALHFPLGVCVKCLERKRSLWVKLQLKEKKQEIDGVCAEESTWPSSVNERSAVAAESASNPEGGPLFYIFTRRVLSRSLLVKLQTFPTVSLTR